MENRKDIVLKQIRNEYNSELKKFIEENYLLNEVYFIEFKLKQINELIKAYEEVGEFFYGDEEFPYGTKDANRRYFGYCKLYQEFLNSMLAGLKHTEQPKLDGHYKGSKLYNSFCNGYTINEAGFQLFEYLIENYMKNRSTKVKYVNILHYLKNNTDKNKYIFNVSQIEYNVILEKMIGMNINKFAKSEQYEDREKRVLEDLERNFRS